MCTRDEVRAAVRSFNKLSFSNKELKERITGVTRYAIEKEVEYLLRHGEIKKINDVKHGNCNNKTLMVEVRLVEKYKRPEGERNADDLSGMRKVWPQYFTDPRIPGKSRFIDNGLRQ